MKKDKSLYQKIYDDLLGICTTLIRPSSEPTYDFIAQQLLDIHKQLSPSEEEVLSFEDRAWLVYCRLLYQLAVIFLVTAKPEMTEMLKIPIEETINNAYSDYPLAILQADGALTALLWLIYIANTLTGEASVTDLSLSIASLVATKTLNMINQFRLQPFLTSQEEKDIPPA